MELIDEIGKEFDCDKKKWVERDVSRKEIVETDNQLIIGFNHIITKLDWEG